MKRTIKRSILALAPAAIALGSTFPAHALSFTTVYDSGVSAAAQTTINSVLANYVSLFNDPVTVSLKFRNSASGLGGSTTYSFGVSYATYRSALASDASSAPDATALATLPVSANNPVNGTSIIFQGRPGLAAVGFSVNTTGLNTDGLGNYFDGVIDLNLSLMNLDRVGIPDPNKYDLQAVASHEIDEVLGTISNVGASNPRPVDLFRYDNAGNRTFTTIGDNAYFSIDGTTLLARYNQNPGGDYGDFWSFSGTQSPKHVQDAFGTPGALGQVNLGPELTILDVIGWNLNSQNTSVPDSGGTFSLTVASVGVISLIARRRQA